LVSVARSAVEDYEKANSAQPEAIQTQARSSCPQIFLSSSPGVTPIGREAGKGKSALSKFSCVIFDRPACFEENTMKTMKSLPLVPALCCALLLSAGLPPAFAQAPAIDPNTGLPVDPAVQKAWERRLERVSFDELPIREVVKYLREKYPEINFVMNGGAADVQVKIELRSVTLGNILDALTFASNGNVRFDKKELRLVTVLGREPRKRVAAELRAFSLSRYLSGLSEEDTERALKELDDVLNSSWEMLQNTRLAGEEFSFPKLSIHRKTKLLIVVGQPEQLEAVEQIVTALQGAAPTHRPPVAPARGPGSN